jgi:hypothetical protein
MSLVSVTICVLDVVGDSFAANISSNRSLIHSSNYQYTIMHFHPLPTITNNIQTVDSLTTKYISTSITNFLYWVSSNIYIGSIVYILVYFIATIALVPGSILTLGAGFIFGNAVNLGGGSGSDLAAGVALASCIVFIGASAGATVR